MMNLLKIRTATLVAGVAGLFLAFNAAQAADATGTWITAGGKSHVKVGHCGGNICGNVVWLREPNDAEGQPKTDIHNENEAQRHRPVIGLPILLGLTPDGDSFAGKIYNAEDGKTYSASFRLIDDSHAEVKGCVLSILCKSQTWTRL